MARFSSLRLPRLGPRTRYAARRIAIFVPQLLGVTTVVFIIIRLLPGDPAFFLAGPHATPAQIAQMRSTLGLDQPIPEQYLRYLGGLIHGDLGRSFMSAQPITTDLAVRFPATLELITYSMIVGIAFAVPLGVRATLHPHGFANRIASAYGLLAGALPDFWWALLLVFIAYGVLGIAPAPLGRLDVLMDSPPPLTGFYTIDSILAGQWDVFASVASHLMLPVLTLAFIYSGPILKMTRSSLREVLGQKFILYARANGLSNRVVTRYALRSALVPVLTISGVTYAYLLGGAVLVEAVFSWGGLGQYAVQALSNSDYLALSGVVLVTTTFSLTVFLVVDLLYLWIDPRIRY